MRLAVVGATGFIGRRLCEVCAARGDVLTALGRDQTALDQLAGMGACAVRADLMDGAAACRAFAGADVVINAAGALGKWARSATQRPHAREARIPLGHDPELLERVNQSFLDTAQIPVEVATVPLEIDDRISNELSRTVICGVTASIRPCKLDSPRAKRFLPHQQILGIKANPKCYYGYMLKNNQRT
jgi:NAD(P)-dependent dehydrogenase (short-subunit alcohol dehydrogenase family)